MNLRLIEINPEKAEVDHKFKEIFSIKEKYFQNNFPIFPLLVKKENDHYKILYGSKNKVNKNKPAYLLPFNIEFVELFKKIIIYHKFFNKLNHFEISNILKTLIINDVSFANIEKNFKKILPTDLDTKSIQTYLSLQKINPKIKNFLLKKDAPLKKLKLFTNLDQKTEDFIILILKKLKPSLMIFLEISENLYEISQRENTSIKDIFEEMELTKIITQQDANSLKNFRKKISKRRYPIIVQHSNKIQRKIKLLKSPNNIKLLYDKSFETKNMTIQITINSAEDINQTFSYLYNHIPNFKDLYKIL